MCQVCVLGYETILRGNVVMTDNIKLYMAPMEGLTVHTFRNAWNEFYGGADKLFTPFIAAEGSRKMKSREKRDILPENNKGVYVVPQIISNNAENFIRFARILKDYGYDEVNLNLGCPSGTVVAKHKGSGFLGKPLELNRFLDAIYSELTDMKVSVKTRIGLIDPDEIYELMKIYNSYPIYELIVHPRIRTDYYKHEPRMEHFRYIYENSSNPLCYNGNVYTVEDYKKIVEEYPEITGVMFGRGLIRNPELIAWIRKNKSSIDMANLRSYHDRIYKQYKESIDTEQVVVFKMKEIWCYMLDLFEDEDGNYRRLLNNSKFLSEYGAFVNRIFANGVIKE